MLLQKLPVGVSFSALALAVLSGGGCGDATTPSKGASAGSTSGGGNGSGGGSGSSSTAGSPAGSGSTVDGGGAASGSTGSAGSTASSGSSSGGGGPDPCSRADLTWKTGNKTVFQSYPAPNSQECLQFNGCAYIGQFSACPSITESQQWVMSHNITSLFPIGTMALHDLCLKSGTSTIVVTVLDTCRDADCSGCCTQNRGSADALVDIEYYTDLRWGINDGPIMWADLGLTTGSGCN